MPKFLVFKKEKVEREFFYKEGNSTVKWTVTQYHAKNERAAPKIYPLNLTGIVPPETLSVQDWVQESL